MMMETGVNWDLGTLPAPGFGWEAGQPNVVINSTLFDFSGRAVQHCAATAASDRP
jgi:hypothetical protein